MEHTKKSEKLSKSGKLKSDKMSKSRNLAKSRKKASKSGNSMNFDAMKTRLKLLTPDARAALNYLWEVLTDVPIL